MRIKICGVTNLADAEAAVDLGAWAVGLVHHASSPRACAPEVAAEIGAALKRRCEVVGVFVNPTLDELVQAAENAGLTLLQLHGTEGPALCSEAARRTGCKVIKAAPVTGLGDIRALEAFHTDFHLLDGYDPELPGGTGRSFEWGLLAGRRSKVPVIVSGGLRPDNVAQAIAATRPFAVDVASGVEVEPGRKDHARLRAFFEAASV